MTSIASSPPPDRWWRDMGWRLHLNGIFKGGGAKGIIYAGALYEIYDRGYWFRAVAGSSAGAITASLIAAGLRPSEILAEVPMGLRGVHRMLAGDLVGSPLFRVEKLASWLDQLLRRQVQRLSGAAVSQPVTFEELYNASGIELYVVAVDVADRQPRVFSAMTTPELAVSEAVLASSAIPVAFRPGRLEVRDAAGASSVHRLMDGGVWANYPAFVFKDPSFRAYHSLEPLPEDSITVGFTLDTGPAAERAQAVGFRRNMNDAKSDKGSFLPWLFRFPPLRFYLMTLVPLVIAAQIWYTINAWGLVFLKDYATRSGVPVIITRLAGFFDGFFTNLFTSPLISFSILGFIVVVALISAVLGGTLLDSGVPAIRTLMSVGTDVPYWTGASGSDHVVRLRVPSWLKTTTFRLTDVQIVEAVREARSQAGTQVTAILEEV